MADNVVPKPEDVAEFLRGKDGQLEVYGCEFILPRFPDPGDLPGRVPLCLWRPKREITEEEKHLALRLVRLIMNNRAEELKQRNRGLPGESDPTIPKTESASENP